MDLTSLLDLKALTKYPVDSGGSCDIYRGRLYDGPIIALKTTRVSQTPNDDSNLDSQVSKYITCCAARLETAVPTFQNMQRIIGIWKECKHPNVVHLIGGTTLRGSLAAVYGWVEYGGVIEYLKRHPEADRYRIVSSKHNSHKTNILVSGSGVPQIRLSLLTSTSWASDGIDSKFPGPSIRWAPELLLAESGGTFASDVYALGMETMTMAIPYPDTKDSQVLMKVMNQSLPSRPRDHIPDTPGGNALWNLMCTCWSFNPANRPSAAHVRDVIQTIYAGTSRSLALHDPIFNIAMEPPRLVVTEDTRGLEDYTDDLKSTNIAITAPFADTALANVYKLSLSNRNGCVTEYVTRNPSCERLRLNTKKWSFQQLRRLVVLSDGSDSTKEGDVYALGMEIYTGEPPYGSMNWTGNVMIKVMSGQLRPSRPIALPPNNYGNKLWEIMNQCWATRPNERPTSEQVYERWIAKGDLEWKRSLLGRFDFVTLHEWDVAGVHIPKLEFDFVALLTSHFSAVVCS
ncbi:protein tyrosine kinase domain-containing protein [Rhizoctonia solani AG-1 IA]|uniref:Protein tyrosine kinase domain-containing protein n=1 Tax=Thanatephorus cucumeris (strain AG1-IA) TaxID=983506 RepID=L8WQN1_THACA|nr:protein tyrosine kinase domain-containing protein [Rhizoctonia solani AG-1 IA]